MSLQGSLGDVPLVDILQFIKFSGRTGTLVLEREGQQVSVGLHEGNIVSVRGTGVPRIGQFLLASGALSSSALRDALATQAAMDPPPPLGALLCADGGVTRTELAAAFRCQVEETILSVIAWSHGSFRFELDQLTPVDDLALEPDDIADMNLNTQHVLLEAARLLDEGGRPSRHAVAAGAEPPPAGPPPFAEQSPAPPATDQPARMRVQVASADAELRRAVAEALAFEGGYVTVVHVAAAAAATPHGAAAVVLVDVRAGVGYALEDLRALRSASPHAAIVALLDDVGHMTAAYEAGASSVVLGTARAVSACLRSVERQQRHLSPDRVFAEGLTASFTKLRRLIGEVRAGLLTAVESLNLLALISESVERAVVFLVLPHALCVMGAFGTAADGRPLAERTRGLRLDPAEAGALGRAVTEREVRCVACDDASLPAALLARVGRPYAGCCAILPVVGGDRVVAVVYADNGARNWPLEEVEFLELVVAQLGMAFENQLLRRALEKVAPAAAAAGGPRGRHAPKAPGPPPAAPRAPVAAAQGNGRPHPHPTDPSAKLGTPT
ncbi:MAG: DUF4388 domain-containing protein [Myxococcales bacterium]|nr:DUF4388 domain-containing protein [Myxococcales bacterium]